MKAEEAIKQLEDLDPEIFDQVVCALVYGHGSVQFCDELIESIAAARSDLQRQRFAKEAELYERATRGW